MCACACVWELTPFCVGENKRSLGDGCEEGTVKRARRANAGRSQREKVTIGDTTFFVKKVPGDGRCFYHALGCVMGLSTEVCYMPLIGSTSN